MPPQSLRTPGHVAVLIKKIRNGKVKGNETRVLDPVTKLPHTFYRSLTLTIGVGADGSEVIWDADSKPLPPETGVDALTDEVYTPIMLAAARSRFQSLREPVLQKHNHSIDKMATHVKTAVNLKAQFVKDYLRPHWETLVREDQGVCNSCCIRRMRMGMGKSNVLLLLLLLLIVFITEARAAIMQAQVLETKEVVSAIAGNVDMLAGNVDMLAGNVNKLNNKLTFLAGVVVVMLAKMLMDPSSKQIAVVTPPNENVFTYFFNFVFVPTDEDVGFTDFDDFVPTDDDDVHVPFALSNSIFVPTDDDDVGFTGYVPTKDDVHVRDNDVGFDGLFGSVVVNTAAVSPRKVNVADDDDSYFINRGVGSISNVPNNETKESSLDSSSMDPWVPLLPVQTIKKYSSDWKNGSIAPTDTSTTPSTRHFSTNASDLLTISSYPLAISSFPFVSVVSDTTFVPTPESLITFHRNPPLKFVYNSTLQSFTNLKHCYYECFNNYSLEFSLTSEIDFDTVIIGPYFANDTNSLVPVDKVPKIQQSLLDFNSTAPSKNLIIHVEESYHSINGAVNKAWNNAYQSLYDQAYQSINGAFRKAWNNAYLNFDKAWNNKYHSLYDKAYQSINGAFNKARNGINKYVLASLESPFKDPPLKSLYSLELITLESMEIPSLDNDYDATSVAVKMFGFYSFFDCIRVSTFYGHSLYHCMDFPYDYDYYPPSIYSNVVKGKTVGFVTTTDSLGSKWYYSWYNTYLSLYDKAYLWNSSTYQITYLYLDSLRNSIIETYSKWLRIIHWVVK